MSAGRALLLPKVLLGLSIPTILAILLILSQSFDPVSYGQFRNTLTRFEKTWAEISEEVLRARHGLSRSYDGLVANLARLKLLLEEMRRYQDSSDSLVTDEVRHHFDRLVLVLVDKEALIERFKTRNAVLHNALLFFPATVERAGAHPQADSELILQLMQLHAAVMDIHIGTPNVSMPEVTQRLERLTELASLYPADLETQLRRSARHGRLIIQLSTELEDLLKRLLKDNERSLVAQLEAALSREFEDRLLQKNIFETALFFVAIVFLLVAVWMHLKLRMRTEELNRALVRVQNHKFALDEHAIVSATDVKGNIIYANRKFCDISGYAKEELLGQNHRIVKSGEHPREMFTEMYRTIASGRPWHGEIKNRSKNGSFYWVAATVVPFLNEQGKPQEYISIRTDITQSKLNEERLVQALEDARQASRAKSEFLANMSHEIRTPMNGILGMVQLLEYTHLNDEQREYLDIVKSSSESLLSIINDILDFSKIEAGRLEMEKIEFNLYELLSESFRSLAFRAGEKGLELAYRVDREVPERLIGDPGRLRQVLVNLVGNAIKFTPVGEILIEVDCPEACEEQMIAIRFSVSDTGIGIDESMQEKIFEAFSQEDASVTRHYGGTGLGLSISARLVLLMGVLLMLNCVVVLVCRFSFVAVLSRPVELATDDKRPDYSGRRALLLEPNGVSRDILSRQLTDMGWSVSAMDESEIAQQTFDLAFVVSTHLRAWLAGHPDARHKCIALIPPASYQGDIREIESMGLKGHLLKPVSLYELQQACVLLESGRDSGHRERPTRAAAQDTLNAPRVLLVEDQEINRHLVLRMLKKKNCSVELAHDGEQALEIFEPGRFDLILMDVQMPKMDGLQASKAIRQRESRSNLSRPTPIVALTANAMKGDREECLAAGMDDYMSKPFQAGELYAMLERHTSVDDGLSAGG